MQDKSKEEYLKMAGRIKRVFPRIVAATSSGDRDVIKRCRHYVRRKTGLKNLSMMDRIFIGAFITSFSFDIHQVEDVTEQDSGYRATIKTSFKSAGANMLLVIRSRAPLPPMFLTGAKVAKVGVLDIEESSLEEQAVSADEMHTYLFDRKQLTLHLYGPLVFRAASGRGTVAKGIISITEYSDTQLLPDGTRKAYPGFTEIFSPLALSIERLKRAIRI